MYNKVSHRFEIDLNDSKIWNQNELIKFLAEHQGTAIELDTMEGVCLDSIGLYKLLDLFKFKEVTVHGVNLVQAEHPPYINNINPKGFQYFDVPADCDYSEYHSWNTKKIFGIMYNRPTWNRIGLASYLYTHYKNQTALNFRYDPQDSDQRKAFELDQLFVIDPGSVKNFANMLVHLPSQLEQQDGYTMDASTKTHTDQLAKFYVDIFVDVVSETFVQGRSFYPTEKTTRPMLLKKPFILMGPKCFLIHLRQMGFKTFHDFWDEDYDGYGMKQRYTQILDLIDSIAKKTETELQYMYKQMQPILEHNHQLLLTKQFTREITYVE